MLRPYHSERKKIVEEIVYFLAFNIKYGSNSKIYEAALIYATQPSLLLGERDQSVYVYNQVALMAIQAMRNETITITGSSLTQYKDLTVIVDPSTQPVLILLRQLTL